MFCKTIRNVTKKLFLFILLILIIYTYYYLIYTISNINRKQRIQPKQENMKYILQWSSRYSSPFGFMGQEDSAFIRNKCKYTNCFITDNTTYFEKLSDFDAIAFNGCDVYDFWPKNRTAKQKYIFSAMESPDRFPVCNKMLDGYFNWTWTYKLDSDFRWGYFTIYDLVGNVVGPAIEMKWLRELKPIGEEIKTKLSSKTKAAAWFVSNCSAKSGRDQLVRDLQEELKANGWEVDIYGSCGPLNCPKFNQYSCFHLVERNYYFYLALENSFAEDYVTEKLLTALNNYAVPVVFGGANYSSNTSVTIELVANILKKLKRDVYGVAEILRNTEVNETTVFLDIQY